MAERKGAGTDEVLGYPQQCRARGEEAKALAGKMKDSDARQAMLFIARAYVHLAKLAERELRRE